MTVRLLHSTFTSADFFDGKLRYFIEHGQMAYLYYNIYFCKLIHYILPIISYNRYHPKYTAVQQKLMQELAIVVKYVYSDHSERVLKRTFVCIQPCSLTFELHVYSMNFLLMSQGLFIYIMKVDAER